MKKVYIVYDESSGPVGYYSTKERAEEGAKEYFNRLEFADDDEQTFEDARKYWLFIEEEELD
jgi:hypothetical protein